MRITDFCILGDIKREYKDIRQKGYSRDNSVEELMQKYHDELIQGTNDDALLFWVGLADAQYACKELSAQIAARALDALEKITLLDWEITPGDITRRMERYGQAPMPERAKFGKPRRFRSKWQIGDTFAYKMTGENAEAYGIAGKYMLFRTVDMVENYAGHLYPVVTASLWPYLPLPKNSEEFNSVPMLKLDNGRFQLPKDVFEYRAMLIIKNEKQIQDAGLQYIGNFTDVVMPDDEVVIRVAGLAEATKMLSLERLNINCCYFCKNHLIYEK